MSDYSQVDPNWETSIFLIVTVISIFALPGAIQLLCSQTYFWDFIYARLLKPLWYYLQDLGNDLLYGLGRELGWLSTSLAATTFFVDRTPELRSLIYTIIVVLFTYWLFVGSTFAVVAGAIIIPALSFAFSGRFIPLALGPSITALGIKFWSWPKRAENLGINPLQNLKDKKAQPINFLIDRERGYTWRSYLPKFTLFQGIKDSLANQLKSLNENSAESDSVWENLLVKASSVKNSPTPIMAQIVDSVLTHNPERVGITKTQGPKAIISRFLFNAWKQNAQPTATLGVIESVIPHAAKVVNKVVETKEASSVAVEADEATSRSTGWFHRNHHSASTSKTGTPAKDEVDESVWALVEESVFGWWWNGKKTSTTGAYSTRQPGHRVTSNTSPNDGKRSKISTPPDGGSRTSKSKSRETSESFLKLPRRNKSSYAKNPDSSDNSKEKKSKVSSVSEKEKKSSLKSNSTATPETSATKKEKSGTRSSKTTIIATTEAVNWYDIRRHLIGDKEAIKSQASEVGEPVSSQAQSKPSLLEEKIRSHPSKTYPSVASKASSRLQQVTNNKQKSQSSVEMLFESIKPDVPALQRKSPSANGEDQSFSHASETWSAFFNRPHQSIIDALNANPTGYFLLGTTAASAANSLSDLIDTLSSFAITSLYGVSHGFNWLSSNTVGSTIDFCKSSTIDSTTSSLVYCSTCWVPTLLHIGLGLFLLWAAAPFIDSFISHIKRRPFIPVATILSFATWVPALLTICATLTFQSHFEISEWIHVFQNDRYLLVFAILALVKVVKIVVHTLSYYFLTYPAQSPQYPTLIPADVTVIVPTVGGLDEEFVLCIKSILANRPAKIIVSTVGVERHQNAIRVCNGIDPKIKVVAVLNPNKREQFIHAANLVQTPITASVGDHVIWPQTFLRSSLSPFEDPIVGIVGTVKRVIRQRGTTILSSFLNYIACICLERQNFECTATYNLDGGVSIISSHTALVRTEIIHSLEYRQGFLNERWLGVGPMEEDEDNFTTRFVINKGYKTVFHNHPEAILRTTLDTNEGLAKFIRQLLRWSRTTWRSNSTSLISERVCWWSYPWTTYAIFLSSFINFAFFYDSALALTLYKATGTGYLCPLLFMLLFTKLIKPFPHLWRNPRDVGYFLGGILFGYMHSLIKLWAFFTAGNIGYD